MPGALDLARNALRVTLGQRLPLTRGALRIAGPTAPVVIRRDRFSIPHIEAENDADAWFGLGFCEAQDRAFQLELRLRTVRGTIAALAGPKALAIDRLSRRIGFRQASEAQLAVLDADVRAQVEAFARGINAGIAAGSPRPAHEFALFRSKPSIWDAADVVAIAKLVSFLLIGNWDVELARLKILLEDGPDALRDLDPSYAGEPAPTRSRRAAKALDRLGEDIAAFLEAAGPGAGSNNWAIAPARTATGRPLLANDPHLDATLPPHWYLAHLRTPEWSVAGAALVGSPAIGAGHNGFCAWGITAGLSDTTDLFVEQIGPDGRSVRRGDAYVPCEVRHEVIEVKGRPPVTEEVLVTPNGPVISPALEGGFDALALRAVWLDARPARGFVDLPRAHSLAAFRAAFETWPLLSQNIAYADVEGNIAWQMVGEVPKRRRGWGTLPFAGWDEANGWDGVVPYESMPYLMNPPEGFVATANNKPVRKGEEPYLGVDWLDPYRFERINEALAAHDGWDVAACLRLQLDETSLPWRALRETLLALDTADADARLALDLLADWDGTVAKDSPAATVFTLFVSEMWQRIARSRAPRSAEIALGKGFTPLLSLTTFATARWQRVVERLIEQPAGWFARDWPAEMVDALATVVRRLTAERGMAPGDWEWGRVRPLTLKHPVGQVKALAPIFNRGPFAWGGDSNTVAQAGVTPLRPLGNPLAVASVRMVVDVGNWDEARFVLPGGQSGNPLSPHYDDQLPLWLAGETLPLAWSNEAVAAATVTTLRLEPLSGASQP